MIEREVIAGDTFGITYVHKQDDVVADLPDAYDYMIGLHQEGGNSIQTFSYQNGDIEKTATGTYKWRIPHALSKSLSGNVIMEMVIYSADLSYVQHCNEPVRLKVMKSYMNEAIEQ